MADAAIFIGWGQVVRGREAKALQVFNESLQYYQRLQESGVIESFEPCLLQPHGGELAGFILIRGSQAKLAELRATEEFQRTATRAAFIVDQLGVVDAAIGASLTQGMATFAGAISELG